MTIEIIKHQSNSNSKGHKSIGCVVFKTKLPKEAIEYLGAQIEIRKFTSDLYHTSHFELSKFGMISEGKPSIISSAGWLTMNQRLIEEWTDLGLYDLDFDYESECINLIKK